MNKQHLLIRIAEFSFIKNIFVKQELLNFLVCDEEEKRIIEKYFENAWESSFGHNPSDLETPFFIFKRDENPEQVQLSAKQDLIFNYIDYLEFQQAQMASSQAQKWATRAIWISIIAIVVQIVTSFFSVKIDESQFQKVSSFISSEVKK